MTRKIFIPMWRITAPNHIISNLTTQMPLRIVLLWRRLWILRICIRMPTTLLLPKRCKRKVKYWMNIPSLLSLSSSTSFPIRAGAAIGKAQRKMSLKPHTSKMSTILPSNKSERRRWRWLSKISRNCEDLSISQMGSIFRSMVIREKASLNNQWLMQITSEASILKTRIQSISSALRAQRSLSLTLKTGSSFAWIILKKEPHTSLSILYRQKNKTSAKNALWT